MSNLVEFESYSVEDAEQDKQELASGGTPWMKLKPGRNLVRFLPATKGKKVFRIYFQHFIERPDGSKASFACPNRTDALGKPCPACAHADKLQRSGNKVDAEVAKRFWPRKRILANVIDRGDADAGPKVLGMPKSVYEKLIAIRKNEDAGGDFAHPVDGFDICIERTGSGPFDTEYMVIAARKNSPLGPDTETMNSWIGEQNDLLPLSAPMEAAAIKTLIAGEKPEPEKKALPEASADEFSDDFGEDF